MTASRARGAAGNAALALVSLGLCLAALEIGYRALGPVPYVDPREINQTEYGNLSRHDPVLGWSGVPGGAGEIVTWSSRVRVELNGLGHRDVEHAPGDARPALVFLGDSFAWGFEVATEAMLVSRLRSELPDRAIFNLSHRGWGTDQSLLAFEAWRREGPVERVVLLFSENDVADNASGLRHGKLKPHFAVEGNELALKGVPVPRMQAWDDPPPRRSPPPWPIPRGLARSHLVYDVLFRLSGDPRPAEHPAERGDDAALELTERLLARLARSARSRGGELLVAFVPSKREIEGEPGYAPYQARVAARCRGLGIDHVDLADALRGSWRRTYHRLDMHWNRVGHAVAAASLRDELVRRRRAAPGDEP